MEKNRPSICNGLMPSFVTNPFKKALKSVKVEDNKIMAPINGAQ